MSKERYSYELSIAYSKAHELETLKKSLDGNINDPLFVNAFNGKYNFKITEKTKELLLDELKGIPKPYYEISPLD